MAGRIISLKNVNKYDESKTNWDIYSLVCDPLPVLALRNLNDYDEKKCSHSTLSWLSTYHNGTFRTFNKTRFLNAVDLAVRCVWLYGGTRGVKLRPLHKKCREKLPKIVTGFISELKKRNIESIWDVQTKNKHYWEALCIIANAVSDVSKLKGPDNPMFGSKILHFLMPELFPVWDTEFIRKKALAYEDIPALPELIDPNLNTRAAREYVSYVDLMVRDLAKVTSYDYARIKRKVLERAYGKTDYSCGKKVTEWHYDDLSPTIFEICLLAKWV